MKSEKNRYNKYLLIMMFLMIFILQLNIVQVNAVPYSSYTYDFWGEVEEAPQAYMPARVIHSSMLGIKEFKDPQDIFIADDNKVYLLDTGNNRVVVMNEDWQFIQEIKGFDNNGQKDSFNSPEGIYVTEKGYIYLADTGNSRILKFDSNDNLVMEINNPNTETAGVFRDNFIFKPIKIGVDEAGRIYAISRNVFDGIMEFDIDGDFTNFGGAPRVTPNLIDYFWSKIGTKEQREKINLFLPTEFSNLDLDSRGFLYATVVSGREELIVRLNTAGNDILRRAGFFPPSGDIDFPALGSGAQIEGPSAFIDIVVQDDNVYNVLDRKRGRIFTYDDSGNLLYTFGSLGKVEGTFQLPVAINNIGSNLVILDRGTGFITIYEPTAYAKAILAAIEYHNRGLYDKSTRMWEDVLKYNANYSLAYSGIGKSLFRKGKYREAMDFFKLGNDRLNYSKAFSQYRREIIIKYFPVFMVFSILVIIALFYFSGHRTRKSTAQVKAQIAASLVEIKQWEGMEKRNFKINVKRTLKSMIFSFHLIFHPFDGFWDLKREKRGNLPAAISLLLLVVVTYIYMKQYTGFIFNPRNIKKLNIIVETLSIVFPFMLWCSINWALTTLMDGKGTIKDIFIYSAFALTPFILINIPLTVVSNFITVEEGAFYYFFFTISLIWSVLLIFFGTAVTHDYEIPKTFLATIGIIAGMAFVIFICLVFFTVIDQVVKYIIDIYSEISLRM